jgi:hypothetical protein
MARRRLAGAVAALSLVAGCADLFTGPVIYPPDLSAYSPAFPQWGATGGELAVEIHGVPFGSMGSPENLAQNMNPPSWLQVRSLTTRPGPQTPAAYRVVMAFSPARSLTGADLCRGDIPVQPNPNAAQRVTVTAAFCAFDRPFSHAIGSGPVGSGPASAEFRSLMSHLLAAILPIEQPDRRTDSCTPPEC